MRTGIATGPREEKKPDEDSVMSKTTLHGDPEATQVCDAETRLR